MGKKDKSTDKWLIKPGVNVGITDSQERVEALIDSYSDNNESSHNICLNEGNEIIYFLNFPDEESSMEDADVAVLHDDEYVFLPKELALDIAHAYLCHIKLLGDAYDYLDKQ